MNNQQLFLLGLQIAGSMSVLGFLGIQLIRRQEERRKFKLFAIRDKWLFLVVTGSLREQDFLFRVFYNAMNLSIAEIKTVTFGAFVEASLKAKSELEGEKREKLEKSILAAPPDVQAVAVEFVQAMMETLLASSLALNILLTCYEVFKAFKARQLVKRAIEGSRAGEAYDAYRYFERMPQGIGSPKLIT